jgi:multiple sugar transport system ATP-binding protein
LKLHREDGPDRVAGRVYTSEPTGDVTFFYIRLGEATVVVSQPPEVRLAPDETVFLAFDPEKLHLFDGESGIALTAA